MEPVLGLSRKNEVRGSDLRLSKCFEDPVTSRVDVCCHGEIRMTDLVSAMC